ncbi:MAG: MBL fold metallo-hydrolase [Cephaloticoccus sp.]|nr:MBL fold metallo-hydrolase [Cephaloticoccus sp.]MCF7759007.1 MBL fold metallo-hydrolase [Cephaloticoccus sp.]
MLPSCSLHQVSAHVWWFTPESRRDRPSLAVVAGAQESLLLDVGASPRHLAEFMAALDQAGVPSPARAVLTHWHWDHVFGLGGFAGPVIAHRATADRLMRMQTYDYSDAGLTAQEAEGLEIPFTTTCMKLELTEAERRSLQLRTPEIIIDDRLHLDLGGVECELRHVGGDHAPDSVVIHVIQDQLLFMGDCLCDTVYTLPRCMTRSRVLPLVDQLEDFAAEIHLDGHSPAPIRRAELQRWIAFIRDAYASLDRIGLADRDQVKADLLGRHDAGIVDDFLPSILAGYNEGCVQARSANAFCSSLGGIDFWLKSTDGDACLHQRMPRRNTPL